MPASHQEAIDRMSAKFIALRRTLPATARLRSPDSVTETRAALVQQAQVAPKVEDLERLGLKAVDPCQQLLDGDNSFWPLCYLDAYVVETADARLARRARATLEPEYLIVPDVSMSLPLPARGPLQPRLPRVKDEWPADSGVDLAHAAGITGKGVRVCVLDTGVDADHREMRNRIIDFRYVPLDPKSNTLRTCRGFDVDGHGTHVASIIAGRNLGVAPGVELMVAAVLESETLKTSLERVVVALDWVLSMFKVEANLDKPVIINMSLGFTQASLDRIGYESAILGFQQIITTLVEDFHVLPVVAVGNEGPGSMRAPAYFADTLSVGAVDYAGAVAPFSGGGRSPLTQEVEPNVAGYGVEILSGFERSIYNRSLYRRMSGTSMAAPYVTGIAALCAAQNPSLQGRHLWQHLVKTALPLAAPAERVGAGLARFVQEKTT